MPRIEVDWTPTGDGSADEFNVYYRAVGVPTWEPVGTTRASSLEFDVAKTWDTLEIGIAPVVQGIEAHEEDWTITDIRPSSLVDFDAPPDLVNFACVQDGHFIIARWDKVADPDGSYVEIRDGSSWDSAIVAFRAPVEGLSCRFGWMASGSTTYAAKVVDQHGQYSATALTATVVVQSGTYWPVQGTHDEDAGGYAGTKTDVEVVSTNLQPEALPAAYTGWTNTYTTYTHPWWWSFIPGGTYVTDAQDAGAVVDEKLDIDITHAAVDTTPAYTEWRGQLHPQFDDTENTPTALDPGEPGVYEAIHYDGGLVAGVDIGLEIDTTPDDPAAAPTWDGWRKWLPGGIYRYRGVRLRVTFNMPWPFIYPRFTGFTWYRRRLNRKQETTGTTDGSGNFDWTYEEAFTTAPVLSLGPLESGAGTTPGMRIISVTATTCRVKMFDTTDGSNMTSETVHIIAAGV